MIVLDEQLLGRQLEVEIAKWYRGTVRFINELRPHTVIKDDAIPELLCQQNRPTFITINEKDFWRKVAITPYFCLFYPTRLTGGRNFTFVEITISAGRI